MAQKNSIANKSLQPILLNKKICWYLFVETHPCISPCGRLSPTKLIPDDFVLRGKKETKKMRPVIRLNPLL